MTAEDFTEGEAAPSFTGEYMNQYSWAEPMHAEIDEISYATDE